MSNLKTNNTVIITVNNKKTDNNYKKLKVILCGLMIGLFYFKNQINWIYTK